jgi:maleylacetate reductase
MNQAFIYTSAPVRVVFGSAMVHELRSEVERLHLQRVLVLSTPGQRALGVMAVDLLDTLSVGLHAYAVMHVPREVADAAVVAARELQADGLVAIGGGSTVGLAKAVALELGLPIIAIPTTYSGSEMTAIWGLTEAGVKRTGRDERVRPRTVIYDPELTLALPATIAAPSGMNALAHCIEALYAPDGNPITALMAEEGIRALATSLPEVVRDPTDRAARSGALYGAWLAGAALGAANMGLHHKLCHTLGGSFNLPHAEVHTVILPHAAAYNATAAPEAFARAARALGQPDVPGALFDLAQRIGAPTALSAIGMAEVDLDLAADLATRNPYANPAPVTRAGVRHLLAAAFHGERPSVGQELSS